MQDLILTYAIIFVVLEGYYTYKHNDYSPVYYNVVQL